LILIYVFASINSIAVNADCPAAPLNPQDRRPDKSVLSIATYNAEWLFLSGNQCPGTGCPWTTKLMAEQHLAEVAKEILKINPDILVLEEVHDCDVLNALNALLNGRNYKPYLIKGTDTATSQNVAILTRIDPSTNLSRTENRTQYPIPGSKCGYNGAVGTYGVSKHFYTTFRIQGLANPLMLVGAHLLAFPDRTDRCAYREAQATVLQGIIRSGLESGFHVVMTGDLNDYDTIADCCGNVPISKALAILKDPIASRPGDELVTAAIKINQASRFTCWYSTSSNCNAPLYSMIDHVLLDTALSARVTGAYIDHAYTTCTALNSDHWPVIVSISTA